MDPFQHIYSVTCAKYKNKKIKQYINCILVLASALFRSRFILNNGLRHLMAMSNVSYKAIARYSITYFIQWFIEIHEFFLILIVNRNTKLWKFHEHKYPNNNVKSSRRHVSMSITSPFIQSTNILTAIINIRIYSINK